MGTHGYVLHPTTNYDNYAWVRNHNSGVLVLWSSHTCSISERLQKGLRSGSTVGDTSVWTEPCHIIIAVVGGKQVKVCYYIARYPVTLNHSQCFTLHPLADLFIPTPT